MCDLALLKLLVLGYLGWESDINPKPTASGCCTIWDAVFFKYPNATLNSIIFFNHFCWLNLHGCWPLFPLPPMIPRSENIDIVVLYVGGMGSNCFLWNINEPPEYLYPLIIIYNHELIECMGKSWSIFTQGGSGGRHAETMDRTLSLGKLQGLDQQILRAWTFHH